MLVGGGQIILPEHGLKPVDDDQSIQHPHETNFVIGRQVVCYT